MHIIGAKARGLLELSIALFSAAQDIYSKLQNQGKHD